MDMLIYNKFEMFMIKCQEIFNEKLMSLELNSSKYVNLRIIKTLLLPKIIIFYKINKI